MQVLWQYPCVPRTIPGYVAASLVYSVYATDEKSRLMYAEHSP